MTRKELTQDVSQVAPLPLLATWVPPDEIHSKARAPQRRQRGVSTRYSLGPCDAVTRSMMPMDNMMGGMWIGMILMVLLGVAVIAALVALSVFLIRRSR